MEYFNNIWNSNSRYVIIFIAIVLVIYIPFLIMYMRKKKKQATLYREQNPDAAKVYLKGVIQGRIYVISINGSTPNATYDSKIREGYFLNPGENIIETQYTWTRPGVIYRTVTKTIGPTKIKVIAEPAKEYHLSFDKHSEEYSFEEINPNPL